MDALDINLRLSNPSNNIIDQISSTKMSEQFEKAANAIKESAKSNIKMTDDEMKQVYSLFKQGSLGDNTSEKPGMLDFKGKAKWEAWNGQKGKSKEDAQKEYVALAKNLLAKYKLDDLANSF